MTQRESELVMWVKRLALSLRRLDYGSKISRQAMAYLYSNNLAGGPTDCLRDTASAPSLPIPRQTLETWMTGKDTDPSSLYMASILSGQEFFAFYAYPHTPDELGFCVRLVDAIPDFKVLIPLMLDKGPEWAAIANNWDCWVARYNSKDATLCEAMRLSYDTYLDRALSTSMERKK